MSFSPKQNKRIIEVLLLFIYLISTTLGDYDLLEPEEAVAVGLL